MKQTRTVLAKLGISAFAAKSKVPAIALGSLSFVPISTSMLK